MTDLVRYFKNPFSAIGISIDELVDYANEHLQRMVANNPGALLNTRINATTVALQAFDTTLTTEETKLAIQKGATLAKDTFREALPANIARVHAAVVAAFGLNSQILMECFPHGREVFGDCNDSALENHLQQLLACLLPHVAQVGQMHIDNVSGLLSTWTGLFAAASTARSFNQGSAAARRDASAALRLELFKNLLTLALNFPNEEDKAALCCPQHLLEDHPAGEELPPAVNQ